MKNISIQSLQEFMDYLEGKDLLGFDIILFRGQSDDDPLLPSIARNDPTIDTTLLEIDMLTDFKRRSKLLIDSPMDNDWEWLIYAQHFGLRTRLLDWTSNPLIALWFACSNFTKRDISSYVYVLSCGNDMLVDLSENDSPFSDSKTKILRPTLNNERIIAQSGWFTAHKYSKNAKRFVSLERNTEQKENIEKIEIPAKVKNDILRKLSIFGVNYRTVYPDITGLCSHLNWKYQEKEHIFTR